MAIEACQPFSTGTPYAVSVEEEGNYGKETKILD
jgi:hypothetical protein